MKKLLINTANKIIDKYGIHKIGFDSKFEMSGHIYCISNMSQFTEYETGKTSITIEGIEQRLYEK